MAFSLFPHTCSWCTAAFLARAGQDFCSTPCRQAAWRLQERRPDVRATPGLPPAAFDYADPPYLNKAHLYADKPSFAGEVDHVALVEELRGRLEGGATAGFALSCSAESLSFLLPLMPKGHVVCAWGKPVPVRDNTSGPVVRWEALVIVGGRPTTPGTPTFLVCPPARGRGRTHVGQKPAAFCSWLFSLLGMAPGDTLNDLFPGSGAVSRAWREHVRRPGYTHDAPSRAGLDPRPRRSWPSLRRVA